MNALSPALPILLGLVMFGAGMSQAQTNDAPAHGRPFFMPEQERERLRALIASQEWARVDYARIQTEARKGNGRLAAYLFALDRDPAYPIVHTDLYCMAMVSRNGDTWSSRAKARPGSTTSIWLRYRDSETHDTTE